MRFKAVPQSDYERVVETHAYTFFVLNYVFLVVFADETLQHDFHRVELSVPERAHQVDLAEAADGQTLAHLVLAEARLIGELEAVEGGLAGEDAVPDGDLVVEEQIALGRLEADHLRSLEEGVGVAVVEQVLEYLEVEDVGEVLVVDAGGQLDLEEGAAIV